MLAVASSAASPRCIAPSGSANGLKQAASAGPYIASAPSALRIFAPPASVSHQCYGGMCPSSGQQVQTPRVSLTQARGDAMVRMLSQPLVRSPGATLHSGASSVTQLRGLPLEPVSATASSGTHSARELPAPSIAATVLRQSSSPIAVSTASSARMWSQETAQPSNYLHAAIDGQGRATQWRPAWGQQVVPHASVSGRTATVSSSTRPLLREIAQPSVVEHHLALQASEANGEKIRPNSVKRSVASVGELEEVPSESRSLETSLLGASGSGAVVQRRSSSSSMARSRSGTAASRRRSQSRGHESPGTESEQPSHLTLDASTSSLSKYIKEVQTGVNIDTQPVASSRRPQSLSASNIHTTAEAKAPREASTGRARTRTSSSGSRTPAGTGSARRSLSRERQNSPVSDSLLRSARELRAAAAAAGQDPPLQTTIRLYSAASSRTARTDPLAAARHSTPAEAMQRTQRSTTPRKNSYNGLPGRSQHPRLAEKGYVGQSSKAEAAKVRKQVPKRSQPVATTPGSGKAEAVPTELLLQQHAKHIVALTSASQPNLQPPPSPVELPVPESADACTTVEPTPPKLAKSVDQHVQEPPHSDVPQDARTRPVLPMSVDAGIADAAHHLQQGKYQEQLREIAGIEPVKTLTAQPLEARPRPCMSRFLKVVQIPVSSETTKEDKSGRPTSDASMNVHFS